MRVNYSFSGKNKKLIKFRWTFTPVLVLNWSHFFTKKHSRSQIMNKIVLHELQYISFQFAHFARLLTIVCSPGVTNLLLQVKCKHTISNLNENEFIRLLKRFFLLYHKFINSEAPCIENEIVREWNHTVFLLQF